MSEIKSPFTKAQLLPQEETLEITKQKGELYIGLPKETLEEKEFRIKKMQQGLKKAIDIPLSTMKTADFAWDAMIQVALYGNIASKSDIEVGAKALQTGVWGAYKNVMINMKDIQDKKYKNKTIKLAEDINLRAVNQCKKVLDILKKRG